MMYIKKDIFGHVESTPVYSFTLVNDQGVEIHCINYGCVITKIVTPDQQGKYENIVLGFDNLDQYMTDSPFFGCVVGRVAGRISGAEFELNGHTYHLAKNENGNHIHGGLHGFDKVIWEASVTEKEDLIQVQFTYSSPNGEEGYPGNLDMKVTYTLNNENEFSIQYDGISDETTLLNMTNHSYFNLSGDLKRDVLNHSLTLKSDQYLELNNELLPTGKLVNVEGTVFDFREGRQIKTGVQSEDPQNQLAGGGYDHPFVLKENNNQEIILEDPESGRTMTVETDEVGVVVYTSNQLSDEGEVYGVSSRKHLGICLETQGLPDAINNPQFPSWVLEKDKPFTSVTKYQFGVVKS
ncbi:aldose 1-epimerase [Lederbergia lenta]|uniref:Aldose 1-epimerase n=2 Tax=Lederbergia lenta TaxID=1467 RepID=A0A2X4WX02_LEDLE|nr:aldose 1-epimerase [Lederbergia lenta]